MHARVILSEPVGLLDYGIPEDLEAALRPGVPVWVPLGPRRTSAYVARLESGPAPAGVTLRPVEGLDPERPALPEALVDLLLFAADYYGTSPGDMLSAALPAMARRASARFCLSDEGKRVVGLPLGLHPPDRAALEVAAQFSHGFTVAALERQLRLTRRAAAARIRRLVDKGWLKEHGGRAQGRARQRICYRRCVGPDLPELSPRQTALVRLLEDIPVDATVPAASLAQRYSDAYGKLKKLEAAGLVERTSETQRLSPQRGREAVVAVEPPPEPTAEQSAVIAQIRAALATCSYATFLLHGVTGSGKTEVYLRIIEDALAAGRTALVLVPEIALTPQLGGLFRGRFGDLVATFHSGLTTGERRDEWERVLLGDARIGLGARSALFLPLRNIGAIIVDEEHETSFKQEETPRYHARDLAVYRGRQEDAVVVLGSATPSLESRANADNNRYRYLSLPSRVCGRPMPEVELIDLSEHARVGSDIFTERMLTALQDTLDRGEQAILFLNRRGFAPYVYCRDCGHVCRCTDCDVSMTLHRRRELLLCHYCGFEAPAPDRCPSCDGHRIEAFGLGTERLEIELQHLLGDLPTVRLDRDTVRGRGDIERLLARFRRGEARVLLGTQMVTKGHDFPGVTLVGVVCADASLNFPDFRAAERTFQLLTQVAGRAGRGERPGRVLVQAFETGHYAITTALQHDYESFAARELAARRELGYPPFSHLALLRFEGQVEAEAVRCATQQAAALRTHASQEDLGVSVLGPAPAPLSRLKGLWRFHVLVKSRDRVSLRKLLRKGTGRPEAGVRQILDVDPFSML